jgi:hypothetical protein
MTKLSTSKPLIEMQPVLAPDYVRNSANAGYETPKNLADCHAEMQRDPVSAEVESIDWIRFLLFGLWLAAAGALAWRHVMWRDEVRALSTATQGENWIAMLRGLHGEGHPALWYLLLRAAYGITAARKSFLSSRSRSLSPLHG